MAFKFKKIELTKEIPSIELLRGIASAMVCYFHLARGNKVFLPDTSLIKQSAAWGWAGVQVFFVISGFVIPYAMYMKNYTLNNFFTFLKKRIIRIEPPYLISILLVLVLAFISTLSPYYRGAPFFIDWKNVLSHIAYLNVFTEEVWLNPVYWSLAIEFQYYILIALTFSFITSKKLFVRLIFYFLFAGLSLVHFPIGTCIFTYAPYFIMGILLFQFLAKRIGSLEFWVLLLSTISLLYFRQGAGLTSIAIVAVLIITYVNKVPAFLRYLGLVSYSLYLIHVPIGGRIINITDTLIHNVFLKECMVFVAFAISIIASAVFYKFVEKVFKKMSGKIAYKK